MARKPRTASVAAASKPAAAPAAPTGIVEPGTPCTVPGGYVLYRAANPAKAGSMRHDRWPLLVAHAGKPDGKAALAKAIADAGLKATLAGTMRYLRKHKFGAAS